MWGLIALAVAGGGAELVVQVCAGYPSDAALFPNGGRFVTANGDRACLWDADTGLLPAISGDAARRP